MKIQCWFSFLWCKAKRTLWILSINVKSTPKYAPVAMTENGDSRILTVSRESQHKEAVPKPFYILAIEKVRGTL